ncbi:MAG: hypothetical protein R3F38_17995, partial [Gammaproteobacteria bacterium]
ATQEQPPAGHRKLKLRGPGIQIYTNLADRAERMLTALLQPTDCRVLAAICLAAQIHCKIHCR